MKIKNLFKYQKIKILPQVDPKRMEPIFKKHFINTSFYSPLEELRFKKIKKNTLSILYSGKNLSLDMEIIANLSKQDFWSFEKDINSYLKVDQVMNPTYFPEVRKTLQSICKESEIDEIKVLNNMNLPEKERSIQQLLNR